MNFFVNKLKLNQENNNQIIEKMAKKVTNEEPLEKQLWKTADKLRKNIDAAELVIKKIENLNNETTNIKQLKGKLGDILRLRVGDYRILFVKETQNDNIVVKILEINHRKEVYRDI